MWDFYLSCMNIIGREVDEERIEYITSKIKEKKELSGIDNTIVIEQVKNHLSKNSKLLDNFVQGKKIAERALMKSVREILRKMHGTYNSDLKKRTELLNQFKTNNSRELVIELMKTHKSTAERLEIYENLYHNIFEITENPSSILDLGCGLNPLSVIFLDDKEIDYLACDISSSDLEIITVVLSTYDDMTIETKPINLFDAKKKNIFSKFDQFDICFLFKIFDSIELSKSHKLSEEIIKCVPADWVVVSFPTRTVSGKKMNYPGRGWFEKMLGRLKLFHRKLEYDNEVFYVIKKIPESKTNSEDVE